MKKSNKKGFTIVELVIVIAVIAILAAVLIPTFVKLVRKSKINNDTQLIRNLNTALEADKVENTHTTMSQALAAAAAFGYDVTKINASATNNEILWDSENDVFCYINDGDIEYLPDSVDNDKKLSAQSNKLWKIYNGEVPAYENQTYSIYIGSAAAATNFNNGSKKVKVGFDAGEQSIDSVTYERSGAAQTVVINTNSASTSLTINAANDTVKHYGSVGSLNIIAVASASYHEFGKAAFAEIATGRIVLESKSEVSHIHLNKTAENFVNITVAKANDVEMPDFTRDPVEIPEGGKLVVALQNGTETTDAKDYVWLTAVGVYEQVTLGTASQAGTNYAANSGNEIQKEAAQQIANNISFSKDGEDYKVTATPVVEDNVITGWNYEVVTSEGETTTYTAEVSSNDIVVKDSSNDVVETTNENVITEEQKAEKKADAIDVLAGKEIESDPNFDNYVARIGIKGYMSIQDAITAAVDNDTIVVLKDITLASGQGLLINKTIKLNLNEKTIMGNSDPLIVVGSNVLSYQADVSFFTHTGHLTIIGNGSIINTNWDAFVVYPDAVLDIYDGNYSSTKITLFSNGGTINTYGGDFTCTGTGTSYLVQIKNNGSANFLAGTFTTLANNGCYGIFMDKASTLNIGELGKEGPVIDTWRACISTNGSTTHECTINIYSGTFRSNRTNSTPDDQSVIQISNATTQIQTVNIYGGYFEQTAAAHGSVFNLRYTGTININISGGTFKCIDMSRYFTGYSSNLSTLPTNTTVHLTVSNDAITTTQVVETYKPNGTRNADTDFTIYEH